MFDKNIQLSMETVTKSFEFPSCWMVLSTSSIRHQHPLHTLMQKLCTYTHTQGTKASQRPLPSYTCGFSSVFGCDTAFVVVHTHIFVTRGTLYLSWD